jgi:hypothetical protein
MVISTKLPSHWLSNVEVSVSANNGGRGQHRGQRPPGDTGGGGGLHNSLGSSGPQVNLCTFEYVILYAYWFIVLNVY